MDMAGGYLKAVQECVPQAEIVFDRFHVERLLTDAVDAVRRALVRETTDRVEAATVKRLRYVLLKNPQHLTVLEEARLSEVERRHRWLHRAYLLKAAFAEVLELEDLELAEWALWQWLAWASRSRLKPLVNSHGASPLRRHPRLRPDAMYQRHRRRLQHETASHRSPCLLGSTHRAR